MITQDMIKTLAARLYDDRKNRRTHPEGTFDSVRRFYPSAREDQDGSGTCVRGPSRAWPYAYMLRCRTKAHCTTLIAAALGGASVPSDVSQTVLCG